MGRSRGNNPYCGDFRRFAPALTNVGSGMEQARAMEAEMLAIVETLDSMPVRVSRGDCTARVITTSAPGRALLAGRVARVRRQAPKGAGVARRESPRDLGLSS